MQWSRQRGIGLLELMLALIVIAAILFMVTRYFKVANENLRVSRATTMINTTVAASYKWLEGNPSFQGVSQGISIKQLVDLQFLPPNFSDGTGINPWGGDLIICPQANNADSLQLVLTAIPQKSCQSLIEKMAGNSTAKCDPTNPCSSVRQAGDELTNFMAVF